MARKDVNINWGSNEEYPAENTGYSYDDYSLAMNSPEALNFTDNMDQQAKAKPRKGKGSPQSNKAPKLRSRGNYQKLDKGQRGYL